VKHPLQPVDRSVEGIGVFQIAPIHLDGGLDVGRQGLPTTAVISPVIPDDGPYHPAIETLTFVKWVPRLLILYPDDNANEIWRVWRGYNLADLAKCYGKSLHDAGLRADDGQTIPRSATTFASRAPVTAAT
jgi:hypothetical protein